ncbi:glycosyltransferase family 2 protein, partial [Shewanella insulae]|uniref:glycosyltransferase family 2 protein n=1 Tax=Shewanella insulae TaxID=2681496 RepID=UPI001EFEA58C
MFDIIIPCYNSSSSIERAVLSAIHPFVNRIIVVDDGSTDESLIILESLSHVNELLVVSKSNGGPGSARNTGLQLATSEYIIFLDSDDILIKDSLFLLKEQLQGSCVDLLSVKHTTKLHGFRQNKAKSKLVAVEDLYFEVLLDGSVKSAPWSYVLSRKYLESTGLYFSDELTVYEDCLFVKMLCLSDNRPTIQISNIVTTVITVDCNSLSRSIDENKLSQFVKMLFDTKNGLNLSDLDFQLFYMCQIFGLSRNLGIRTYEKELLDELS